MQHRPLLVARAGGVIAVSVGSCMGAVETPALALDGLLVYDHARAPGIGHSRSDPIVTGHAKSGTAVELIRHTISPLAP